jgi:hypothetical protein
MNNESKILGLLLLIIFKFPFSNLELICPPDHFKIDDYYWNYQDYNDEYEYLYGFKFNYRLGNIQYDDYWSGIIYTPNNFCYLSQRETRNDNYEHCYNDINQIEVIIGDNIDNEDDENKDKENNDNEDYENEDSNEEDNNNKEYEDEYDEENNDNEDYENYYYEKEDSNEENNNNKEYEDIITGLVSCDFPDYENPELIPIEPKLINVIDSDESNIPSEPYVKIDKEYHNHKSLYENACPTINNRILIPMDEKILIGNKTDLDEGIIEKEQMEQFLADNNMDILFEISAKNGKGISKMFEDIVDLLIKKEPIKITKSSDANDKYEEVSKKDNTCNSCIIN